jgi:xanthine dehydrogenase accessory factor
MVDRPIEILRALLERIDAGRPISAALVWDAEGSTPRGPGARCVVDGGLVIAGTIGGGQVEAEAVRLAAEAGRFGVPVLAEVPLLGDEAAGAEPVCGGRARILIDPAPSMGREAYEDAVDAVGRREKGILRTILTRRDRQVPPREGLCPSAGVVRVDWLSEDLLPGAGGFPGTEALRGCLARETPRLFRAPTAGEEVEVLAEPLVPEPRLLIAGGGHIGQALAALVVPLGFEVTVVDDRPEFAAPALYPAGVAARCGDIEREVRNFPIGPDTHVVIVTREHRGDATALAACIRSPAASIGMIGSRRKVALLREEFLRSGRATAEEFDRVFAPIGLAIGAVTVPEIAVSIAAQLVAARRKGAAAARIGGMPRR